MKRLHLLLLLLIPGLLIFGQSALQDNVDDLQLESLHSAPIVLEPNDSMALFHFIITDPNGNPQSYDVIHLKSTIDSMKYAKRPNKDGLFDLLLREGDTLQVRIKSLGRDSIIRILAIPLDSANLRIYNYEISYSPARTIILENVYYDTGKATLRPESFPSLNDLAELLLLKPEVEMEIYGHTDNVGGAKYNIKLSQGRAESVMTYLIEHGIEAHRLTPIGFGFTRPIDTNETDKGRQNNRRTEVRMLYD